MSEAHDGPVNPDDIIIAHDRNRNQIRAGITTRDADANFKAARASLWKMGFGDWTHYLNHVSRLYHSLSGHTLDLGTQWRTVRIAFVAGEHPERVAYKLAGVEYGADKPPTPKPIPSVLTNPDDEHRPISLAVERLSQKDKAASEGNP